MLLLLRLLYRRKISRTLNKKDWEDNRNEFAVSPADFRLEEVVQRLAWKLL